MAESLVSKEAERKEIVAKFDSVTLRLQNIEETTSTAVRIIIIMNFSVIEKF